MRLILRRQQTPGLSTGGIHLQRTHRNTVCKGHTPQRLRTGRIKLPVEAITFPVVPVVARVLPALPVLPSLPAPAGVPGVSRMSRGLIEIDRFRFVGVDVREFDPTSAF